MGEIRTPEEMREAALEVCRKYASCEGIAQKIEAEIAALPFATREVPEAVPTRSFPEDARRGAFRSELENLINRHSIENDSDTPDFQLSKFLMACLIAYEDTARSRDAWFKFTPLGGKR